jgi:hypothetical protein
LVDSFYRSLRTLVEGAPKLFVNLAKAVGRYFTRRS